ncbi:hypothetical protein DFH09DRAFT_330880 [Mycena vulgaris]|nr:hypothetical protein DFH09DRAFT_330880 [Mycena vulgaris]
MERWPETVEALRGYYAKYLAPPKDTMVPTFPVEGAVRTVVPIPLTAGAPHPRDRSPAPDPSREPTPSMQAPGLPVRDTPGTPTDRGHNAPMAVPTSTVNDVSRLLDPDVCKNTPPRTKVKTEEGVVDFSLESAAGGRRLTWTHIENLLPLHQGSLACTACIIMKAKVPFKCPPQTPLEVLSAHVEEQHPRLFETVLEETGRMSDEQVVAWFGGFDDDV